MSTGAIRIDRLTTAFTPATAAEIARQYPCGESMAAWCCQSSPALHIGHFKCCRPVDHAGPHVAYDLYDQPVAAWPLEVS